MKRIKFCIDNNVFMMDNSKFVFKVFFIVCLSGRMCFSVDGKFNDLDFISAIFIFVKYEKRNSSQKATFKIRSFILINKKVTIWELDPYNPIYFRIMNTNSNSEMVRYPPKATLIKIRHKFLNPHVFPEAGKKFGIKSSHEPKNFNR